MNLDPTARSPALQACHVDKYFGSVQANRDVFITLRYGRIHALLGENGAGKSTLLSILFGLTQPDRGELKVDGNPVVIRHPADALKYGIALVQQHFSLIPSFSVLDNIQLGQESGSILRYNRSRAAYEIQELLERYQIDLPLHRPVGELPVGLQQQVEIAKVLYRHARIILFDEPTAALVSTEITSFLHTLNVLTDQGIAIALISHRLPEVLQSSDDVTVLRHGQVTLQGERKNYMAQDLVRAMVGENLPVESYEKPALGNLILDIATVSTSSKQGHVALHDLNLRIHQGEILGIAGVAGNGQEEFVRMLLGIEKVRVGKVFFEEKEITRASTRDRLNRGIAYIPQDRQGEGILSQHSVMENLLFSWSRSAFKKFWLPQRRAEEWGKKKVEEYRIQVESLQTPIRYLSGGHQQRTLIARELDGQLNLILAHNPTRGLDLRAARFVHEKLHSACLQGASMILLSSELSELFLLCHRIAVMSKGRLVANRKAEDWNAADLGRAMVGAEV